VTDGFNFSAGMPSDEVAEYLQMFVDETTEQLDDLVEVLLVLETAPDSASHLNESFRLIHSIKGAAAMMGLDGITSLTHHLESRFEHLRSGRETLDRPMMNVTLRCVDFLRGSVERLREGKPLVSAPELIEQLTRSEAESAETTSAVFPLAESTDSPPVSMEHPPATLGTAEVDLSKGSKSTPRVERRIIAYLDRTIDLPELKAELILARLSDLAVVNRTSPDVEELGRLVELRTLQIWLESSADDTQLRAAVDIVGVELIEIDRVDRGDLSNHSTPIPSALAEDRNDDHGVGVAPEITRVPLEPTEFSAKNHGAGVESEPETLEQHGRAASQSAGTAAADPQSRVVETVRVDIQRLDRLMNLAGELVVNRARFVQLASQMTETFKKSGLLSQLRDLCEVLREQSAPGSRRSPRSDGFLPADDRSDEIRSMVAAFEEQLAVLERGRRSFLHLNEAIDHFSRVSDGLQRGVLDTRMVPVGPLFNRFKRNVRDISAELGKKVQFVIRGENTELDKRMIDELGDPLIHLVRNAIDHGLESESVRRSRGKPEAGTLTLEAAHSGNNVLITISDDGGGIHTERVKQRAIERGIVTAVEAEGMSEGEIAQFIWAPGFSTAEVVSDISGRGVGMDIVKTRISELNGTIEVDSTVGKGTRFIIRLPLTLAIIRTLLFQLDQGTFAAPIENVREIVSVHDHEILSVQGRDSIEVRGEFIPLVRIDDVFDWHGTQYHYGHDGGFDSDDGSKTSSVLILISGSKSMGLVVAELKGCQDIVVKSLDENFTDIRGLAGASILGDGSVCLLLDVVSCLELARQRLRGRAPCGATSGT
jgi:two-component system chemotaxis sensor kinase CheA